MQRYFVSPDAIQAGEVRIIGDDVKHISRVMRFAAGDEIICADGKGTAYLVRLKEIAPEQVVGVIISTLQEKVEPDVKVTLIQGLPKSDKMDLIVQKCTEVGIHKIVPAEMQRSIVQYDAKKESKRRERWQRIAKEAAEQAHRLEIPEITEMIPFRKWLEQNASEYDMLLIAYEGEGGQPIRKALEIPLKRERSAAPVYIAVIIGPEGGLDIEEVSAAKNVGSVPITLGPRILRTETAGMIALAVILYHFGEMGG